MYAVIYEPEAEKDLFEILLYYVEQGGFTLGETIERRIQAQISLLKTMPHRSIESQLAENVREFLIERLPPFKLRGRS
jgi:plasmid stabilization system protein ParE